MAVTTIQYERPWLYDKQRAAIFHDKRYGIVEASTKSGKTVGCLIWLAEQAMMGKAERNYWWIAPSYAQTKIAYRRMKNSFPIGMLKSHEGDLTHTLPNQTVIWFKTAEKPDNLYGEDVYGAVIDEATRCREESWHAIRTTLTATRGPVRIIGNVKGRKNWAYHMARRAEAGRANMYHARITAYDAVEAGILDAEEIEDARTSGMPENVFRELFLAEPSDDEGNPFGIADIRACIAPMSVADPFAWGWDLAKSVDYTVGIALDTDGAVCKFERFQKPWSETKRRIMAVTDVQALVDSTGVGDPVVEDLQRQGSGNFHGFKFTAQSKQQLMEGLAVAIQQRKIRVPDGPIVNELESFEYEYTRTGVRYSAPVGLHDDCVDALALAVQKFTRPQREIRIRSW